MKINNQLNRRIHAVARNVNMAHSDLDTLCKLSGTTYEFLGQERALKLLCFLNKKKIENKLWDRNEQRFISRSERLKKAKMKMSSVVNISIQRLCREKDISNSRIYGFTDRMFQKPYKELSTLEGWKLYHLLKQNKI